MRLSPRDRKALSILAAAAVIILGLRYIVYGDKSTEAPSLSSSIPETEKRLARLRQVAVSLPAKQEVLNKVIADAAAREKSIIAADTAPQAQAELLLILRRLGKEEGIDMRGGEMGAVRQFGDDYGVVATAVTFECRIEQLVNLLAAIANEPTLIATSGLRINAANPKEKTVNVRLDLAAVVPRALAPEKKGSSF
jgi:hypothetical protein